MSKITPQMQNIMDNAIKIIDKMEPQSGLVTITELNNTIKLLNGLFDTAGTKYSERIIDKAMAISEMILLISGQMAIPSITQEKK